MNLLLNPIVLSALVMGLLGGAHCVAMCGGVVGVLCSAAPRCPGSATKQARYWLAYHAGRIASYALLGLLFASAGALLGGTGAFEGFRYALRAIAALCMLFVGLHLMGLPSIVSRIEALGAPLWRRLSPIAKRLLPLQKPWHALVVGAVWGFLPCGLLYGALVLAASAETPATGAVTMAAFGLGTLPVMIAMSAVASTVARALAHAWVRRAAGCVVLGFGLFSTAGVLSQTGVAEALGLASAPHQCCPHPKP